MWSAYHGRRIYLDANAIIFALEAESTEVSRSLLNAIDKRSLDVVTSEITIAEVLVKPLALGDRSAIAGYQDFFRADGAILLAPVSRSILEAPAELSASTRIKLPDAIHVATARATSSPLFLTYDERIGRALPADVAWLRFPDVSA